MNWFKWWWEIWFRVSFCWCVNECYTNFTNSFFIRNSSFVVSSNFHFHKLFFLFIFISSSSTLVRPCSNSQTHWCRVENEEADYFNTTFVRISTADKGFKMKNFITKQYSVSIVKNTLIRRIQTAFKQWINGQIEIKFSECFYERWDIKMAYEFQFIYCLIGVAFGPSLPTFIPMKLFTANRINNSTELIINS